MSMSEGIQAAWQNSSTIPSSSQSFLSRFESQCNNQLSLGDLAKSSVDMNLQMQALEKVGENIFLLAGAVSGLAILVSYYLFHVSQVQTYKSLLLAHIYVLVKSRDISFLLAF